MPTEMMECPVCGFEMQYVHEHDACKHCGLIIGCCEGTTIGVGEALHTGNSPLEDTVKPASDGAPSPT